MEWEDNSPFSRIVASNHFPNKLFCTMAWSHPCPLSWVRHQTILLGLFWEDACTRIIPQQDHSTRCAREPFQHNEGEQDHSMTLRFGVTDSEIQKKIMLNRDVLLTIRVE
jgi:hypothetical protein